MLEALIGLVDKSVAQRVGEGGGRYRLLDTIRQYGAVRLTAAGGTPEAGSGTSRTTRSWAGGSGTSC
ncbi:hypothetical protein NKH77_48270 [Streptomyces sp. M19]